MSDTPRTDSLIAEYPASSDPTCNTAKEIELEELARQLERELSAQSGRWVSVGERLPEDGLKVAALEQALGESVGSIFSDYALAKILDRADVIRRSLLEAKNRSAG